MKYNPNQIEAKWQQYWAENQTFKAQQPSATNQKPKYYVLDMFPYPSGAGLHVGHPLGYIASDIYARYKRHKGFNVLHPQGYDSFGLPAEQYAIQTGQHPDKTTRENIARYREQLDRIGFSFDWSREVRTSDPNYYKHTQWIFIQLFDSWYNKTSDKAEDIATLTAIFEKKGNTTVNAVCDEHITPFTANEWNAFSKEQQEKILLQYRLTYLAETEVNWCPGLGTVLANDEIVNGVSERGGFPVIRKKMTQWSMRISAYAERLLQGLDHIDWTESLKESQRNWVGKSVGAEIYFPILTFPKGEGNETGKEYGYMTGGNHSHLLLERAKEMRANPTDAEKIVWSHLKFKGLDCKFRQQHLIGDFIVDFVCLSKKLIVEIDGGYHNVPEQMELDKARTNILEEKGYSVVRFTNKEVISNIDTVLSKIKQELNTRPDYKESDAATSPSPLERDGVRIFTTRPDTIFGVTFMTLAPEHELVSKITTPEQKAAVEAYIDATTKRSERERMADVKTISGVFTGAYAEHPFTKEPVPVWIGDYVLAGYGTGAVMAVPCGDERDYAFAHFFKGQHGMPEIKNIFVPLTPKGGTVTESSGTELMEEGAFTAKQGFVFKNSDFLNGLGYKEATQKVIDELEKIGQGKGKTNYRLRDAVFSRQRYWGEPFPVYYVNGLPQMIDKQYLPIRLPEVEKYLPTEDGQPPLGNAKEWHWLIDENGNGKIVSKDVFESSPFGGGGELELNTMPGWAGSSWYWLRYMDAHNEEELVGKEAEAYWQNVDLYIGGSEHATGHLLYSRFWNKFLKDRGFITQDEPFKKLINQGMILGESAFVYRLDVDFNINYTITDHSKQIALNANLAFAEEANVPGKFGTQFLFSKNTLKEKYEPKGFQNLDTIILDKIISKLEKITPESPTENPKAINEFHKNITVHGFSINPIHVDVSLVNSSDELDIEKFKAWREDYTNAEFITEESGKYIVGREVEKMSKSKYNVVTPDDICNEYGADTLRLYEMFLGPLEQAKPWNTGGISGVFGFLKKLWRLYFNDNGFIVTNNPASKEALKTLHKTIKKVQEDIEGFSFNTSVSQFMICVNELTAMQCHETEILEPLAILISPYAPHIAEELWSRLGHTESIAEVPFPEFNAAHLVESSKEYPVSFNGKTRFTIELPLDLSKDQIEAIILKDERTIKQLDGKTPNKIIIVPGKIINLVG